MDEHTNLVLTKLEFADPLAGLQDFYCNYQNKHSFSLECYQVLVLNQRI